MGWSARNFLDIDESVDERRHIAAAHISYARTKSTLAIASHCIDIAPIALDKDGVLLTAANIADNDIEAAHFGQVVDHFVAANTQLPIIIIYNSKSKSKWVKRKASQITEIHL